jgi:hypothetical protein
MAMHVVAAAQRLWAAPCTALGLAIGAVPLALGGRIARIDGALEITYREHLAACGRIARTLPFRGIVFGHVILAISGEELARIRAHERVHVAQYERWGPLFLIAYGASSLWQLLRGRRPYRDNAFEVQARHLEAAGAFAARRVERA